MDQIERQLKYLLSLGGPDSLALTAQLAGLAPLIAHVRALKPSDSSDATPLPGLGGTGTKYWLDLASYDPAATMRDLHIPALVLQGMRDFQVAPDQLDDWLRVVGPRTDITVKRYPSLSHLFIAGTGTPSPADYATAGHVDPQVITDIAAWVRAVDSRK